MRSVPHRKKPVPDRKYSRLRYIDGWKKSFCCRVCRPDENGRSARSKIPVRQGLSIMPIISVYWLYIPTYITSLAAKFNLLRRCASCLIYAFFFLLFGAKSSFGTKRRVIEATRRGATVSSFLT